MGDRADPSRGPCLTNLPDLLLLQLPVTSHSSQPCTHTDLSALLPSPGKLLQPSNAKAPSSRNIHSLSWVSPASQVWGPLKDDGSPWSTRSWLWIPTCILALSHSAGWGTLTCDLLTPAAYLRSFSACNRGISAMRASRSSICRRL